jgi:antitoxin ParD1/3/4
MATLHVGLAEGLALGVLPFLLGDAIKVALAAGLLPSAWRLVRHSVSRPGRGLLLRGHHVPHLQDTTPDNRRPQPTPPLQGRLGRLTGHPVQVAARLAGPLAPQLHFAHPKTASHQLVQVQPTCLDIAPRHAGIQPYAVLGGDSRQDLHGDQGHVVAQPGVVRPCAGPGLVPITAQPLPGRCLDRAHRPHRPAGRLRQVDAHDLCHPDNATHPACHSYQRQRLDETPLCSKPEPRVPQTDRSACGDPNGDQTVWHILPMEVVVVATRNVVLSQHQHELVESLVNSGRYQNASEVLREGLRLVERAEAEEVAKVAVLRKAAEQGWSDLASGRFAEVDDESLDDFLAQLGARASTTRPPG